MADPISWLAIGGMVAGGVGSIVGAAGARKTADANAQAALYQSQVARNNAIIAERNANAAREAGRLQAEAQGMKTRAQAGAARAEQGASGIDVNSGTNLDVQESITDLGHLDALTILNNAAKNAQGFQAQGMNFAADAGLDVMKAKNAGTAGDYAVATSLLGGASSFSDKWLSYNTKGVKGF